MPNQSAHEVTNTYVFLRAGLPAIVTCSLIPLAFVIPLLDSTKPPYFDLTLAFSQLAYLLSQSGGKFGAPMIALLMLTLLINHGHYPSRQKPKVAGIVLLIATICAGGGASLNEHGLKAQLKIPRPNITWLAGDNGSGPLGMTANDFYQTGDKQARSATLLTVLTHVPAPVLLSAPIEAHWVEETGYSLPSGHSYAAMFFATFFLLLASTYIRTKSIWLFYALLPWALAVCYSRPILRVHTPADIAIGAIQGLVVGLIAWAVARILIHKHAW